MKKVFIPVIAGLFVFVLHGSINEANAATYTCICDKYTNGVFVGQQRFSMFAGDYETNKTVCDKKDGTSTAEGFILKHCVVIEN